MKSISIFTSSSLTHSLTDTRFHGKKNLRNMKPVMFDSFFRARLITLIFISKFPPEGGQKAPKPLPEKLKMVFSNRKKRQSILSLFPSKKGPQRFFPKTAVFPENSIFDFVFPASEKKNPQKSKKNLKNLKFW